MLIALDKNGNRTSALLASKADVHYCQVCKEKVQLNQGSVRQFFAHYPGSDCAYGKDKDNKSPWHIRMQSYFPVDNQEVRFVDAKSGEPHIADVFIPDDIELGAGITVKGTVIEFQHSPISEEEFMSRTRFHLENNRRIVWVFDESSISTNENCIGRFRRNNDDSIFDQWGYQAYRWMRQPRRFLRNIDNLQRAGYCYSVFVYTGTDEKDIIRRIVYQEHNFEYVLFSKELVQMKEDIDVNCLFSYDDFWKIKDEERSRYKAAVEMQQAQLNNIRRSIILRPNPRNRGRFR